MRNPDRLALLVLALVLVGCPAGSGPNVPEPAATTAPRKATPKPSPSAEAPEVPSTAPSVAGLPTSAPVVVAPARRDALLAALHEAFPAGRATRVTSLLGEASGVLSNNTASLISEHGGSIISDNGGGYRLLQAPVLPGEKPPGTIEFFVATTEALVYEVTAWTDQSGRFRSFDRTGWEARTPDKRLEALVDEFAWHEVIHAHPFEGALDKLGMTYKLKKVSSTRIPFADKIEAQEIFKLNFADGKVNPVQIGWNIAFALDMALPGATPEQAQFKAVAGEGDLELVARTDQDGFFSIPRNLVLSGENARGKYAGKVTHGQTIEATIAHDAGAELVLTSRKDGTRSHVVTATKAGLRLKAELKADNTGTGVIEDLDGTQAGTVAWDAAGVGTITFADGSTLQAPLF